MEYLVRVAVVCVAMVYTEKKYGREGRKRRFTHTQCVRSSIVEEKCVDIVSICGREVDGCMLLLLLLYESAISRRPNTLPFRC